MSNALEQIKALPAEAIERGWQETFSTQNPYCPCDLKSFTKAVRWAEHTLQSLRDEVGEAVGKPAAWLYLFPHDGETDHALSLSRFLPSWIAAKGATETPLYRPAPAAVALDPASIGPFAAAAALMAAAEAAPQGGRGEAASG